MNKVETIPVGRTLYHGSKFKLKSGFPVGKEGSWFATNPVQSILHVASRSSMWQKEPMYFYIYKTTRPLNVIKFDTSKNMNNWAIRSGFKLPENSGTFAFSNQDYILAKYLCQKGIYDGWWFPNDQSQVMMCKPQDGLRFVKVMEVTFPYGKPSRINFEKGNNKGQYIVGEGGRKYKYKLVNVKLNNLRNLTNLPKNAIYSATEIGNNYNILKVIYFNSSGKQLPSINHNKIRSPNGININGKKYYTTSIGSLSNVYNRTLRERILEKSGLNLNPRKWYTSKVNIITPNQKRINDAKVANFKQRMNEYWGKLNKYTNELNRRQKLGLSINNLVLPNRPKRNYGAYANENTTLPLPEPARQANFNAGSLYNLPPNAPRPRRTFLQRLGNKIKAPRRKFFHRLKK